MRLPTLFLLPGLLVAQAPERLSLAQAFELALAASPEIQQARLRALEQRSVAAQARAALGPQLAASVATAYQASNLQGIGLNFPGIPARIPAYRTFDARPSVSQTVLDLSLLARVRAAQAWRRAAEGDAGAQRERTLAAVADLYFQALQSDSRERAAGARRLTAAAVLDHARERFAAGTGTQLDVSRAAADVARGEGAVIAARRDRGLLAAQLWTVLGRTAGPVVELEPVAPRLPLEAGAEEALVQEAVTRRAEFRVLDDRRRALDQELRTARLERWPKVQVAGDYGVLGQDPANALATWRIAAGATVPLWTSGRIENEAKAAALRLRQWEQERRALELAVRREIVTALLEEQAASGAGAAAARAAAAARESLELARLRYEHGVASSLDVSIAQGGLADAEEDEMRWRHAGLAARARLAWARGDVRLFLETR